MSNLKAVAPGVYLRGKDQVQLKFSCKRIESRITVSYQIPKYSKAERDRGSALRGQLTAAAEHPGTDDELLIEYLDDRWLDRLGISKAQDAPLEVAVRAHMVRYETATKNTRTSAQRECNAVIAAFGAQKRLSTFAREYSLVRDWILRPDASEPWRKKTAGRLKLLLEDARRDGILDTHPLESASWWKDMQPARTDHTAALLAAVKSDKGEAPGASQALTGAEVEAILKAPTERTDELALIQTGFATGMRIGELFALAAEDIDFDAGVIRVDWNFTSGILGLPKHHKQRPIPLPDELVFVLRRQVKKYAGKPCRVCVEIDGNAHQFERTFLFRNTSNHGNSKRRRRETGQDLLWVGNDAFRKFVWTPQLKRAGVDYRPPYSMRHTYATNMIEREGMDYRDLAAFMGHTDPDVTRKRYVKTRDEDQLARIASHNQKQKLQVVR